MLPSTVCYGLGCFSFLVLVMLMVVRHRPTGIGLGGIGTLLVVGLWMKLFPSLRKVERLE